MLHTLTKIQYKNCVGIAVKKSYHVRYFQCCFVKRNWNISYLAGKEFLTLAHKKRRTYSETTYKPCLPKTTFNPSFPLQNRPNRRGPSGPGTPSRRQCSTGYRSPSGACDPSERTGAAPAAAAVVQPVSTNWRRKGYCSNQIRREGKAPPPLVSNWEDLLNSRAPVSSIGNYCIACIMQSQKRAAICRHTAWHTIHICLTKKTGQTCATWRYLKSYIRQR